MSYGSGDSGGINASVGMISVDPQIRLERAMTWLKTAPRRAQRPINSNNSRIEKRLKEIRSNPLSKKESRVFTKEIATLSSDLKAAIKSKDLKAIGEAREKLSKAEQGFAKARENAAKSREASDRNITSMRAKNTFLAQQQQNQFDRLHAHLPGDAQSIQGWTAQQDKLSKEASGKTSYIQAAGGADAH